MIRCFLCHSRIWPWQTETFRLAAQRSHWRCFLRADGVYDLEGFHRTLLCRLDQIATKMKDAFARPHGDGARRLGM